MLIEREGEVVTREEIRKQRWPNDTLVKFGHSINAAIKKLCLALGDSSEEPKYVETVSRRGYRLRVVVDWGRVSPASAVPGVRRVREVGSPGAWVYPSCERQSLHLASGSHCIEQVVKLSLANRLLTSRHVGPDEELPVRYCDSSQA